MLYTAYYWTIKAKLKHYMLTSTPKVTRKQLIHLLMFTRDSFVIILVLVIMIDNYITVPEMSLLVWLVF